MKPQGEKDPEETQISNLLDKKFKATVQRNTEQTWGKNLGIQWELQQRIRKYKKKKNNQSKSLKWKSHYRESTADKLTQKNT